MFYKISQLYSHYSWFYTPQMLLDINGSPQILAKSPHIMVLVLVSLWFYIPQTTVQRCAEYPRKKFYPTHSLAKFRGESAWQYPPPGAFVPRFLSPPPSPPQQQWRPHHGRSTGGPPPGSAPWRKKGCRLVATRVKPSWFSKISLRCLFFGELFDGSDENHLGELFWSDCLMLWDLCCHRSWSEDHLRIRSGSRNLGWPSYLSTTCWQQPSNFRCSIHRAPRKDFL